jgi:CheY-like chemotaxis protein
MGAAAKTRRNVLVIDDDAIMRELLSAVLSMEGHAVQLTSSGDEAVAWLAERSEEIDIILADLHMPGLQGAGLVERLKQERAPSTLLIGMSGTAFNPVEAVLFEAFLQKPFEIDEFVRAVETASRARNAEGGAVKPPAEPARVIHAAGAQAPVLDEAIYARLATILAPAQLQELYRVTVEDVLRRVEAMREAVERGDLRQCRSEAHAIKGGCGMVGAAELSALAAAVEAGTPAESPPFADFADACTRLQGMLDARF